MKYKPLDRYPYMENDLAEREGYVPNEVFALYVESADAEFRDHERRIVRLEDFVEDMPNNYVTRPEYETYVEATDATLDNHETRITALEETKATKTELQDAVEDLQEQINTKVDQTEYDNYTEVTDGRLDALEAFKDDVPNTYATKTELNECCNEVKGRLEDLEEFAEDVPNTYATKEKLNEYETATDARLDTLEAFKDDVPNTYATKEEFNECCNEVKGRLKDLEEFADDVPNTYATKEELNEYETATDGRLDALEDFKDSVPNTYVSQIAFDEFAIETDERLDALEETVDDIPNTYLTQDAFFDIFKPATDTQLGVIKTNSADGIKLNEDDQLDIDGRVGVFEGEEGTGFYLPRDREPVEVGPNSLFVTDAKNLDARASRALSVVSGGGLTIKKAPAGSTVYKMNNTYSNRINALVLKGGRIALDEETSKTIGTVPVVSVQINGEDFTPDNYPETGTIDITVAETVNPDAPTTSIRGFGVLNSYSSVSVGNGINVDGGGRSLFIGSSIVKTTNTNANALVGQRLYSGAGSNFLFGEDLVSVKKGSFLTGRGNANILGDNYLAAFGSWSLVEDTTLALVVGDGTSDTNRHNLFEVRKDGSIIIADRNITQELTDATNNITEINTNVTNLSTQVETIQETVDTYSGRITQLETTVGNHTTEISTLDSRADSLETTTATHTQEISSLDGRADSLENTTASHTRELNSMDSRVDVIEEVIDPERMGYAQYSFTPQNGGLAELFPNGPVITNQLEVTRVVVTMSAQICNFSMYVQLKNSLTVGSTMYTPSMDSSGFFTSQADNGKVFLGRNRSATGSYPTFELMTYNTILRNTTSATIASGSIIETSWTMVVAPTFKSLATRWAAYKIKNPI